MLGDDEASQVVVGSFTVDGMTYALNPSGLTLVAVAPSAASGTAALSIPPVVSYGDESYEVTAIGSFAFYLSAAMEVELPASIDSVDDLAFRSSNVERVSIADDNASFATFDGALYSADLSSLLLIPEGRQGAVRVPSHAALVNPSVFSHCAGVDAIVVDAGCPHLSSENGLLYDASGSTLLRAPAGAVDITIREGCTTIAAGAMEGCAKLEIINAPSTVTAISPDVFSQPTPTVSILASALAEDAAEEGMSNGETAQQISALVALTAQGDVAAPVDPSRIEVVGPQGPNATVWESEGFRVAQASGDKEESIEPPAASLVTANSQRAAVGKLTLDGNGGSVYGAAAYPVTAVTWDSAVGAVWSVSVSGASYSWTDSVLGVTYTKSASRSGYEFAFWGETATATSGFTSNIFYLDQSYPATPTIYAIWKIPVTWSPNSGYWGSTTSDTAAKSETKYYGQQSKGYGGSTVPKRTGYTFKGWATSSGATSGLTTVTIPNAATTYYAVWVGNTITLTWNSQGGSAVASTKQTYSASAKVKLPAAPTRAGYTFAGWFTAASGGTQVTASTALPLSNPTYHAHWNANTITCTWNSQGGSAIGNTSATYSASAKVPMPSSNPTKAGYTFAGWYTAASGGTQVTSNTTLPTSNPTYHAHWNANKITCTWNSQGGSSVGNTSATYSASAKVPMPSSNPTKAGYTFAGWYTAASGGSQVTSNTALPTSNPTYHAHWTANTITLAWDAHGGTAVPNTSATYSPSAKVPMPAATTRAGWTFAGWWTAETGGAQVTSSTALPTSSQTYHARWSKNSYRIDCDYAGGSASNPTTYDVETATFALKNPTRQGFVFTGWSGTGLSGEANMAVTIAKGSTGDRSYAAHWLPAVSADVPLEVTAKVDLLGIEEPTEATGWIESRSGGSLKVAEVSFAPLAGAAELFGSRTADVSLEAFAEGSASADVSFALNAAAVEADAAKLAPFALPNGYGTRIGVGYRFAIPEDVTSSLDVSRFEGITTPVGQVVYTVALA